MEAFRNFWLIGLRGPTVAKFPEVVETPRVRAGIAETEPEGQAPTVSIKIGLM
jgi:hypothetical protein